MKQMLAGRTIGHTNARSLTVEELSLVAGGARPHLTSATITASNTGGKSTIDAAAQIDF